jgi:hypothetical protein
MTLNEAFPDDVTRLIQYIFLKHDLRTEDSFLDLRYKIACLLEDLIVSDNTRYIGGFSRFV